MTLVKNGSSPSFADCKVIEPLKNRYYIGLKTSTEKYRLKFCFSKQTKSRVAKKKKNDFT